MADIFMMVREPLKDVPLREASVNKCIEIEGKGNIILLDIQEDEYTTNDASAHNEIHKQVVEYYDTKGEYSIPFDNIYLVLHGGEIGPYDEVSYIDEGPLSQYPHIYAYHREGGDTLFENMYYDLNDKDLERLFVDVEMAFLNNQKNE